MHPWDAPSVQALVDYGIQGMKIASADLTNHELLRDVASRGLPMLVSTGMSREEEIRESVALLRNAGASYALLQCQSAYPAPSRTSTWRTWTAWLRLVSAWSATRPRAWLPRADCCCCSRREDY